VFLLVYIVGKYRTILVEVSDSALKTKTLRDYSLFKKNKSKNREVWRGRNKSSDVEKVNAKANSHRG